MLQCFFCSTVFPSILLVASALAINAGMILAAHAQGDESQDSLAVSKTLSNNSEDLAWNRILTVSADTNFVFPGHEFYTSVSAQGISAEIGPEFGQRLCDAYRIIFKKISLPFSSLGSSSLIEHQAKSQQTKYTGEPRRCSMVLAVGLHGRFSQCMILMHCVLLM